MSREFRLYLQVLEGHLGLMPSGSLTEKGVTQILGAAQAGLRVYPVIVVNLKEVTEMTDDALARLEEGLQRLVEEKRLVLGLEPQKWTLQTPPQASCRCQGDCRRCACRTPGHLMPKKQAESA